MELPAAYQAAAKLEEELGDPRDPASVVSFASAVAHDEREEFPQPLFDALVARGYLRQMVPRQDGGLFGSFESAAALQRAVSRRDLTCAIALGQCFLGSIAVFLSGTPAQRARAASLLLAGQSMGLALTEEEHGSDVLAGGTRAERQSDGYLLTGRKWLINNGSRATALTLFARTAGREGDGELHAHSLFLLDKQEVRRGTLTPLPKIRTHGIRGADISGLVLEGAEVSLDALLGAEGSGAELLLKSLQITRTGCAAFALGAADSALRLTLDFASARTLYGAPLVELPQARAELLGVFLDLLVCDAAALAGARAVQAAPEQLSLWSAAIKYFVPVTAESATRAAARVLGARHYLREQFADGAFQKLLRDAAVVSLFDGSTAVNLDGVGTQLLRLSPSRAAPDAERAASLAVLFSLGAKVPPIDPARLQLTNAGRCDITQGLPSARAALARLHAAGALEPEIGAALVSLGEQLQVELERVALAVSALQARDRVQVKRSPELFALAARHAGLFAAACALHLFLGSRGALDPFFDEGAWLVLVLDRALGGLAGAHPLSARVTARMLALHEEERAFALVPLPLGRRFKTPGAR